MSESVQGAVASLRNLGTADELRVLAREGLSPKVRPKVNSHVHLPPNFSAFETVAQAVGLAAKQNVGVLGASNYYHFGVYEDFAACARKQNVFPLFGVEIIVMIDELLEEKIRINDPGNPGKMYICGKGITHFERMTPEARRLMETIRSNDSQRMERMIARIAEILRSRGVDAKLDEQGIIDMVARRHGCEPERVYLQERHVAQAFQEALCREVPPREIIRLLGEISSDADKVEADAKPQAVEDAVKVQEEIRSHLMKAGTPGFVPESFISFDQAYELILQLGGVSCYPTLADGTDPICEYEHPVERLIDTLRENRIYCAEFIPVRNTPEVLAHYVRAMRSAGLVVAGGTEHNTLEMIPLEPTCRGGAPLDKELKEIFWEGACVLAGHQFLGAHGECGFVDAKGNRNPAFRDDEERIEAFRRLGAAVIQRYYETNES